MNADFQMHLVWPSREYLPGYVAALQRGWSPDNMRQEAGSEELARIAGNAEAFLASAGDASAPQIDPEAATALHRYAWPGNIAELRAVVERARLLARDGVIRVTDLALTGDAALDLAEVERRHIRTVLEAHEWHQGRAAETLGIAPKTLYRKMREFGLQKPVRDTRA